MSEEKSKNVGVTEYDDEARDPESMKLRRTGISWSSTWSTLVLSSPLFIIRVLTFPQAESPDIDNESIRSKSRGQWLSKCVYIILSR
jgi:hypothetical protein